MNSPLCHKHWLVHSTFSILLTKSLLLSLGYSQAAAPSGVWPLNTCLKAAGGGGSLCSLPCHSYSFCSCPFKHLFPSPSLRVHPGKSLCFCSCFWGMNCLYFLRIFKILPSFLSHLPLPRVPSSPCLEIYFWTINNTPFNIKYLYTGRGIFKHRLTPKPVGLVTLLLWF